MQLIQSRRVAITVIVCGSVLAVVGAIALIGIFATARWDFASVVTAAYLFIVSLVAIWHGVRSVLADRHT